MSASKIYAMLDTTELSRDSRLTSAKWASLRRAINDRQLALAVSEVTLGEVSRQVEEKVAKWNDVVREQFGHLTHHLRGIEAPSFVDASTFKESFRKRLLNSGVIILDLPEASHSHFLARDLAVRKPFNRGGVGYRDALIWLSFVEWVQGLASPPNALYFVTANASDFAEKSGSLHADLREDLSNGEKVRLLDRLQSLVDVVRPPVAQLDAEEPLAVRNAKVTAVDEVNAYAGFPFDDLPIEEPFIDVPQVESGRITTLNVWIELVELFLVDTIDEMQIWNAIVPASITVRGKVADSVEVRHLFPDWQVIASDDDFGVVIIEGTFDSTWSVDLRIDASGQPTDAAVEHVILRSLPAT